jgi:hypothetical protein
VPALSEITLPIHWLPTFSGMMTLAVEDVGESLQLASRNATRKSRVKRCFMRQEDNECRIMSMPL